MWTAARFRLSSYILKSSCGIACRKALTRQLPSRCRPATSCRTLCTQSKPSASSVQRNDESNDDFFSTDATAFHHLPLPEELAAAVKHAGFSRPAQVQWEAYDDVASGNDVVLAAQTGSGKTLAYLLPIMAQLLARNHQAALHSTARDDSHAARFFEAAAEPRVQRSSSAAALVLCPNVTLCQQVVAVANSLCTNSSNGDDGDDVGEALLRCAFVSSSAPPPFDDVRIIVSTPRGLLNLLWEYDGSYGQTWTWDGLTARLRHVVFDEADALLSGSYRADVDRLLEKLKLAERAHAACVLSSSLRIGDDEFARLPRHIKMAGYQDGVEGMLKAGYKSRRSNDVGHDDSDNDSSYFPGQPWRYRQHVFVAATLPAGGTKSIAQDLRSMFPKAMWISGNALHQPQSRLRHRWVLVDDNTWEQELCAAVRDESDAARVLVFAKDVAAARAAADALRRNSVANVLEFHKDLSQRERDANLAAMNASSSAVLCCTDAAARGIDIQNVTHVVQADFAASAVDFLHRAGRTARAGRDGHIVSLYRQENLELVNAIRSAVENGQAVEGAFSRGRSFRRTIKRYGHYVPRQPVERRAQTMPRR